MEKLTENETNAEVFRTVTGELPASHPCVKELKVVMDKNVMK